MENVKNFDENGYDTKYSGGFSNVQRSHQEYLLVRNQMLGNLFGIAEVVDDNTEYALNDEALNAKENTKDKEVYNIEDYSQEDFTQEEILKAIAEISDSPYENPDGKDFPYWCNGEVVVLYVKNGYLTYVIR